MCLALLGCWCLVSSAVARPTLKTLAAFYGTNGAQPYASLALGMDGNFYGSTVQGGASGVGTLFKVTPAGVLTTLLSFNETNGALPMAPLLPGLDGNFYGTTSAGGSQGNQGTVFMTSPAGMLTTLGVFAGLNGSEPQGQLVQNITNGYLYGTTRSGGSNNLGNLFMTAPPAWLLTLVQFNSTNAVNPVSGLTPGSDGNFYGTSAGVSTNPIPIFSLNPDGIITTLALFDPTNGVLSGLVQANGNFYGTTSFGGADGLGSIFMVSPSGAWTNLASFDAVNGAVPIGGLVQGFDGNLYGTTTAGGAYGFGTVFVMTPGGVLTSLFSFAGTNGAVPLAPMLASANGSFYGTTTAGGDNGVGTVFEITSSGAFTNLASFGASNPGQTLSRLVQTTNGILVGIRTVTFPGANSASAKVRDAKPRSITYPDVSTAFEVSTGGVLTTLATFAPSDGEVRGVVQAADGNFYGITSTGGVYNEGSIFMITPDGALTNLISFSAAVNGALPTGGLALGANGELFGTTLAGGTNGWGTFFMGSLASQPVITSLFGFGGQEVGANPIGGLAQGSDGNLYGTASTGGNVTSAGTLFQFSPTLTNLVPLYNFSGSDGAVIESPLIQDTNGLLYGTSFSGGTNNVQQNGGAGTFFSVSPLGAFTSLLSFGGTNANAMGPFGGLLLGDDGNFYGTTTGGGAHGQGTIFSLTPSGTFSLIYSFSGGADGAAPYAGLTQGTDGNFYGVTAGGGKSNQGTVFQLSGFSPVVIVQPTNQTVPTGSTVTMTVVASGSAPLSYQWLYNSNAFGNGRGFSGVTTNTLVLSNAAPANSGAYSVIVRNAVGSTTSSVATIMIVDPFGSGRPTIAIQSPAQKTYLDTDLISVSGTANGTVDVAHVYYQLNNSGWRSILASEPGTALRWATPPLPLLPGTNVFEAYAENIAGTPSTTNTALFVPSPYLFVAGAYNGLFYNSNQITATNAGFFSLNLSYLGSYNGNLQLAGSTYSLVGNFLTDGLASQTINRQGQSALAVQMHLDLSGGGNLIWGVVSNSAWVAQLSGYRAVFNAATNPAPQAGSYTLVIPGSAVSNEPLGDSTGTVTVDTGGNVRLNASLADGTRFAQVVTISQNGQWPLYASLYGGRGLVLGWTTFASNPESDFVSWIKPASVTQLFPQGFSLLASPFSSRFVTYGSGTNWLGGIGLTNLTLVLNGGDWFGIITNQIQINKNNAVTSSGTNRLSLSFSSPPGTFQGSFITPAARSVSFSGVMLQDSASGYGYFPGTNQSGQVSFGP